MVGFYSKSRFGWNSNSSKFTKNLKLLSVFKKTSEAGFISFPATPSSYSKRLAKWSAYFDTFSSSNSPNFSPTFYFFITAKESSKSSVKLLFSYYYWFVALDISFYFSSILTMLNGPVPSSLLPYVPVSFILYSIMLCSSNMRLSACSLKKLSQFLPYLIQKTTNFLMAFFNYFYNTSSTMFNVSIMSSSVKLINV